jgi:hypothetical protein
VNKVELTFKSLAVSLRTTRFNIKKFHEVLALRGVFCADLKKKLAGYMSISEVFWKLRWGLN